MEIWPGSGPEAARRGTQTRRRAHQRPRGVPGDEAKIEEALRRLRGAEVLELNLKCDFTPFFWAKHLRHLSGTAQRVGCLRVSSTD